MSKLGVFCAERIYWRRRIIQGTIPAPNFPGENFVEGKLNRGKAAIFTILRNNLMKIKNLSLHKRCLVSKIMSILYYGAEI
jgi:hypothetical protein